MIPRMGMLTAVGMCVALAAVAGCGSQRDTPSGKDGGGAGERAASSSSDPNTVRNGVSVEIPSDDACGISVRIPKDWEHRGPYLIDNSDPARELPPQIVARSTVIGSKDLHDVVSAEIAFRKEQGVTDLTSEVPGSDASDRGVLEFIVPSALSPGLGESYWARVQWSDTDGCRIHAAAYVAEVWDSSEVRAEVRAIMSGFNEAQKVAVKSPKAVGGDAWQGCPDVGAGENSGGLATDIRSRGPCSEATSLITKVASDHNFYSGPRQFEILGYQCEVETTDDGVMPSAQYSCVGETAAVEWTFG